MPDNAQELLKKRKQERAMMREKTKLEMENNGGVMPTRSIGTHLALNQDDGDPLRVRGEWGTKYNDEEEEEELPAAPKPKSKEELEIEEKLSSLRKSATLHRDVLQDRMMQFNYKLSDYDEEAEERKKAVEARKVADMKKREELEASRLLRVSCSIFKVAEGSFC